ncbi:hypothetical protein IF1G_06040 [Cordyceps javanica]|uniref:Uncharacterized protein n=1 Tax=Cordyceps javanica TaxID=43265 RepID=A0A545V028_9HYPO|nr:hypothetical protein IF1G_06040 [Cordyceps javanica]
MVSLEIRLPRLGSIRERIASECHHISVPTAEGGSATRYVATQRSTTGDCLRAASPAMPETFSCCTPLTNLAGCRSLCRHKDNCRSCKFREDDGSRFLHDEPVCQAQGSNDQSRRWRFFAAATVQAISRLRCLRTASVVPFPSVARGRTGVAVETMLSKSHALAV